VARGGAHHLRQHGAAGRARAHRRCAATRARRGRRPLRQDDDLGVLLQRHLDRPGVRRHRQPARPRPDRRRFVGWSGGAGRRVRRPGRTRWGRRWLHPHPRGVLRRGRVQAHLRAGAARAVGRGVEDVDRDGAAGPHRRRRRAPARRPGGLRPGRPALAAPGTDRGPPAAPHRRQRGPRLRPRRRRRAAGLPRRRRRPRRRGRRGRSRRAGDRVVRRHVGDDRQAGGPLVEPHARGAAVARGAGLPRLRRDDHRRRLRPGPVPPRADPRRVRRPVRPHRCRCAVHPDRGVRRFRRRPALPRADRRRPGHRAVARLGALPLRRQPHRAPACTVPIGTGAHGLPVGGQLLGPRLADRTVLRIAELLQNTLDPPTAPPTRG
jgi:hypothetical protein